MRFESEDAVVWTGFTFGAHTLPIQMATGGTSHGVSRSPGLRTAGRTPSRRCRRAPTLSSVSLPISGLSRETGEIPFGD